MREEQEVKFRIEIKVGDEWRLVHPPRDPPYEFATREEAETMARVLYPRQFLESREGSDESVRIVEKEVS
jgi:hypothetical protein